MTAKPVLFIVGGVLPILYLCWLSIRYMVPAAKANEETENEGRSNIAYRYQT